MEPRPGGVLTRNLRWTTAGVVATGPIGLVGSCEEAEADVGSGGALAAACAGMGGAAGRPGGPSRVPSCTCCHRRGWLAFGFALACDFALDEELLLLLPKCPWVVCKLTPKAVPAAIFVAVRAPASPNNGILTVLAPTRKRGLPTVVRATMYGTVTVKQWRSLQSGVDQNAQS